MNGNIDKTNQNKYAEEEIDLLGLLFEKYVDGAEYNHEKGVVSIPKEAIDKQ